MPKSASRSDGLDEDYSDSDRDSSDDDEHGKFLVMNMRRRISPTKVVKVKKQPKTKTMHSLKLLRL